MANKFMTDAEARLMEVIWEREAVNSTVLVAECLKRYEWKKSTTYTNLKKLTEKGFAKNSDSTVTPVVTRKQYEMMQKQAVIKKYFNNSLPQFLAAFIREEKLSKSDIDELERIIRDYREE